MLDTHICVLLDRSGSMQDAKSDHEGGLRSFIRDQARDQEDNARFTLIQFDSHNPCEVVFDQVKFEDDLQPTLVPRGNTPLLDAIMLAVAKISQTPAKSTVLMIITDGLENCSKEATLERVKSLLQEKQDAGWTVLYLGANVDAFHESRQMGVVQAYNYANKGHAVKAMYAAFSHANTNLRSAVQRHGVSGQSVKSFAAEAFQLSEAQQQALMGEKGPESK